MKRTSGYSLLELIIAVFIIGGLLGFVMCWPRSRCRQPARRTLCASNLRQIGTALMMYADLPTHERLPSIQNDPMLSLNLLYKEYINDPRVFSCVSKAISLGKLREIEPIAEAGVRHGGKYLTKYRCSYGYDPDAKFPESQQAVAADMPGNHPNTTGQNVLFIGGNVEWRDSAVNKLGVDDAGKPVIDPDIFAANPELAREVDSYIRQ